jgi:hypothetical protein
MEAEPKALWPEVSEFTICDYWRSRKRADKCANPIRPSAKRMVSSASTPMNLAQALSFFLSYFAYREGPGVKVTYPSPQAAYTALHTDVSQSLLARFHNFASLHPDFTARQVFNVGDDLAGRQLDGQGRWKNKLGLVALPGPLLGHQVLPSL